MKTLTPVPPEDRPAPAAFDPVPRLRDRHDGWTPQRQRAFIAALADCGSVRTAANMVNMSSESAYALRRHPAAAGFRDAWQAAQAMGVLRLKDEAFDRAMNGELVPVMSGGKLAGFRRKRNDRLLMFILRHYGAGPDERRHTIRHITAKATAAVALDPAAAMPGEPRAAAAAAQATVTAAALSAAPDAEADAARIAGFDPVPLDAADHDALAAALGADAARATARDPVDDPAVPYLSAEEAAGLLEGGFEDPPEPFTPGEPCWTLLGDPDQLDAIAAASTRVAASRTNGEWDAAGERLAAAAARRARYKGDDWQDYVDD